MAASFTTSSGGGTTTASAPPVPAQYSPIHTGNTVFVRINGKLIGFVQNFTPSRSVSRIQVHQVGTPLIVDAPVGAANVQVTLTDLLPVNPAVGLLQFGVTPKGSLVNQVNATPFNASIHASYVANTPAILSVINCLWTQDSLQIVQTTQATYTVTFIGQDLPMFQ